MDWPDQRTAAGAVPEGAWHIPTAHSRSIQEGEPAFPLRAQRTPPKGSSFLTSSVWRSTGKSLRGCLQVVHLYSSERWQDGKKNKTGLSPRSSPCRPQPNSRAFGTPGDSEHRERAPRRAVPGARVRASERARGAGNGLGAWSERAGPCVRLQAACVCVGGREEGAPPAARL